MSGRNERPWYIRLVLHSLVALILVGTLGSEVGCGHHQQSSGLGQALLNEIVRPRKSFPDPIHFEDRDVGLVSSTRTAPTSSIRVITPGSQVLVPNDVLRVQFMVRGPGGTLPASAPMLRTVDGLGQHTLLFSAASAEEQTPPAGHIPVVLLSDEMRFTSVPRSTSEVEVVLPAGATEHTTVTVDRNSGLGRVVITGGALGEPAHWRAEMETAKRQTTESMVAAGVASAKAQVAVQQASKALQSLSDEQLLRCILGFRGSALIAADDAEGVALSAMRAQLRKRSMPHMGQTIYVYHVEKNAVYVMPMAHMSFYVAEYESTGRCISGVFLPECGERTDLDVIKDYIALGPYTGT